jgi:peptide/nickel transport system permease protein
VVHIALIPVGMVSVVLRRIGFALLVLIGAGVTVSLALSFVPDSSLDLSRLERFRTNLQTLATFDYSRSVGTEIPRLLWDRGLNSLTLIGGALVFMLGIGVPLGVGRALRPESHGVQVVAGVVHTLSSIPILVWAFGLLMLSGRLFGVYPDFTNLEQAGGLETILIYAAPMMALGIGDGMLSDAVRNIQHEAEEELDKTYVRALRARGVSIAGHLFRGTVSPVFRVVADKIAYLISGTIVVEYIFNVAGLAREIYLSLVSTPEYTVVIAATMLFVLITVGLNLLCEFLALAADPRLRQS